MYILWHDGKFIIGFLVLILIVQATFGDDTAEKFCLLTLMSMLILNANTFVDFLKNNFAADDITKGQSTVHESESGRLHGGASRSF